MRTQRAEGRFVTRGDGWVGRYCFSYGEHYDAANTSFGALLACNEFVLDPGAGFAEHEHRAVEIVTWVVEGTVLHDGGTLLRPGHVQVLSSGSGVTHAEVNASPTEPARFLQVWLASDEPGAAPRYALADVSGSLGEGLALVVGEGGPVTTRTKATLYAGRLARSAQVDLPTAARVHVFVVRGAVHVGEVLLEAGDELRAEGEVLAMTVQEDAEVLVWALP
jgi:redox-sensitive bicupin YhaK (pirin superfamily)